MGKALIIKGADFSVNGISPEFIRLSWIGMSTSNGSYQATPQGQFISSGIFTTLDMRLVVVAEFVDENFAAILPGCDYNTISTARARANATYTSAVFGRTSSDVASVDAGGKKLWDGGTHTIDLSRVGLSVDGTLFEFSNAPTSMSEGIIYLDSASKSSSGHYNTAARLTIDGADTPLTGAVKIKNVRIYSDYTDNSSLVMDAIPVKRLSDNVVCFYNKVAGTYHVRNNGSTPEYGY